MTNEKVGKAAASYRVLILIWWKTNIRGTTGAILVLSNHAYPERIKGNIGYSFWSYQLSALLHVVVHTSTLGHDMKE